MSFDNRTIFAPASVIGESGITVIRVSGRDVFALVAKIFSRDKLTGARENVSLFSNHSAHHGYLFDGSNLTDEVVITIFKSPNSYTGEDVIEISIHGGQYNYRKINDLLLKIGVVRAEPGEFSKRAFLNGKMDLAQAEAVADLIRAKTESANLLAMKQLTGEFSNKLIELKDELINYCSLLELELDFSEEGIDLVSRNQLLNRLEYLIERFEKLTISYESGKIIRDGIKLAVVGKPNVGKSSIFNYLLNENRAIVSDIPGTTRDYIQEPLIMNGIQFNLIDTAGIRKTKNEIEKEGVRRTQIKLSESDIVLEVEDLTSPELTANEYVMGVPEDKIIKVYNKFDIAHPKDKNGLYVSALTGENMDILQQAIVDRARALINMGHTDDIVITNIRHRDCLLKSCEYLVNAKKQIIQNGGNELISFEIREAIDSLAEITGKTTNVDILNNIFAKFCIGK